MRRYRGDVSSRDLFFEGSEKKIEITVTDDAGSLRLLGEDFWSRIVASANAEIISKISNEECDAYLLSESSLFVWADRFLMLTCGISTLADAVLLFIEHLGRDKIRLASYQRKNEYLSHLQGSSFADDLKRIRAVLPGEAFRVGHLDSHHHYLYTSKSDYLPDQGESTSELLMYHIQGSVADYLRSEKQSASEIRQLLQLERLFGDFEFNDFLFEPFGYSINGICGDRYMTIHITPQEKSSYVSLETNLAITAQEESLFSLLLATFNPGCWDIIGFNTKVSTDGFPEYTFIGSCSMLTSYGSEVNFSHYQQRRHEVLVPEPM